jgi:hypothetical protein
MKIKTMKNSNFDLQNMDYLGKNWFLGQNNEKNCLSRAVLLDLQPREFLSKQISRHFDLVI